METNNKIDNVEETFFKSHLQEFCSIIKKYGIKKAYMSFHEWYPAIYLKAENNFSTVLLERELRKFYLNHKKGYYLKVWFTELIGCSEKVEIMYDLEQK